MRDTVARSRSGSIRVGLLNRINLLVTTLTRWGRSIRDGFGWECFCRVTARINSDGKIPAPGPDDRRVGHPAGGAGGHGTARTARRGRRSPARRSRRSHARVPSSRSGSIRVVRPGVRSGHVVKISKSRWARLSSSSRARTAGLEACYAMPHNRITS